MTSATGSAAATVSLQPDRLVRRLPPARHGVALPQPLFWLFVARIIDGISGGNLTIAQAYIADITKPRGPSAELRNHRRRLRARLPHGPDHRRPAFGLRLRRTGIRRRGISFLSILATVFLLPETQHRRDPERRHGRAAPTCVSSTTPARRGCGACCSCSSSSRCPSRSTSRCSRSTPPASWTSPPSKRATFSASSSGCSASSGRAASSGPMVRKFGERRGDAHRAHFQLLGVFYVVWVKSGGSSGSSPCSSRSGNIAPLADEPGDTGRPARPPGRHPRGDDVDREFLAHRGADPRRLAHRRAPPDLARLGGRVPFLHRRGHRLDGPGRIKHEVAFPPSKGIDRALPRPLRPDRSGPAPQSRLVPAPRNAGCARGVEG